MSRISVIVLALILTSASTLAAQSPDSYLDPGAATLLERARAFRNAADSSILSYTATVRSRVAATVRMPLKDRTLFRAESASRVRWSRDGTSLKQVLAHREQSPDGVEGASAAISFNNDEVFDPTADRITLGLGKGGDGDDDIWLEHPLMPGAEAHYRYQSGDTMTIRLQDGRTFRSVELRVLPRVASGHVVSGSLWIDPSNGAVVQAVYRLSRALDIETEVLDEDDREGLDKVPGMFKPMEFNLTLVAMEYSLHDLRYWLPRFTRIEGYLRAGVVRTPAIYEMSYEIDEVITASPETVAAEDAVVDSITRAWSQGHFVAAAFKGDSTDMRVLLPVDTASLLTSPELPEPVWKDSPTFATSEELDNMYDRVDRIPASMIADRASLSFQWGYGGQDLLRYNRIEALSIGARVRSELPWVALSGTARLGIADLRPNVVLSALRSTQRRSVELDFRHALVDVDEYADAFGMGNSASALLLGRDAGEYYRSTRASLSLRPAEHKRAAYGLTLFAQHDDAVERETNATLRRLWNGSFEFRPNIHAAETELYGATFRYRPWWGPDPYRVQAGFDLMVEGATGGFEFARTSLVARSVLPVGMSNSIALEIGGGTAEGDVPAQRRFYLGGAHSLRGYDPSTLHGTSFARARGEVSHRFGFGGIALFSDAAWAGERKAYVANDILYSAGAGISVLDGLLRFDLARALSAPPSGQSKWRLELYLDALL